MDGDIDGLVQPFPVHHGIAFGDGHHPGDIDRCQVAGLVGQQGLLAARIGAFNLAQLGIRVVPVDQVQEDQPRIAGLPGHVGQQVEYLFGVALAGDLLGAWVNQVILLIGLDPFHEVAVHGDRYIEVAQVLAVFLGRDELLHVRMIDV